MNKFFRKLRIQFIRKARKNKFWSVISSISKEKYAERISGSIIYGLLSSIAVNFFFRPGKVYSSGVTGLAQIVSALAETYAQLDVPIALVYYGLNIPLLIVAWYKIGNKFTIFTFITVSFSSLFIQFMPHVTLTNDPLVNTIFGGLMLGTGIGFALRNNVSSGGTDIVSILIRKKTGKQVGSISLIVNASIMLIAGMTFGWQYALYSMVALFISSRMTDVIFVKQKRMQAMIITSHPERVIKMIHKRLHRGVTIINGAEGAYNHEQKTILLTIITRAEFTDFKYIMKKADKSAFVSVSDNVNIIGRFVESD
ncbi:YitT family protein [Streptococcus oriscaviae]|uniref:YitT family protein n=2 Tax=Streptococcus oriscaviae TaxID=2781599 RepID=A0ABX7YJ86_9STRE|nr:YitT family protein [Streptococcus oriscaviae]QUE53676.1 YitT family protein [Streptococcus oriscaviae]